MASESDAGAITCARSVDEEFFMSGGRLRTEFFLAVLISCALAFPCKGEKLKAKSTQLTRPGLVVQPVPTTGPLSLAQMPASPPRVAFSDGQLTITAENSTLGDILRGVRSQTGASIDVPGNATERVVGQFGPGPARDVLAALLNGSHFDYVLLGSSTNPEALDRVILISISSGTEPATEANVVAPPQPKRLPAPAQLDDGAELPDDPADEQQEDSDVSANSDGENDAQPAAKDEQSVAGQDNPIGQQPANMKTPKQMLQELQQRQQQMQQGTGAQPESPNTLIAPGGGAPAPVPR
jgi:hypothetical protein